jgi:multiple sugar transport system ATP-binding protein
MTAISIRNLEKRFGSKMAVKGVSFDLQDGEFLAVVGPSGCGKTTTLRMIAGLEPVSGGEIRFGDRLVNDIRPRDRNIGMVFQDYAIFPHLTVFENIAYGLRSRGEKRDVIAQRVPQAAKMFGLEELLSRKPKQLSGGQRQRVALARAMVRDADVYLYDEPLSNLDAQLRHQAREDILALHREKGKTSIYVTHDQSEAMSMGDRIAVMRGGELMQIGSGTELYEHPQSLFVAFFIGTPSINVFEGTLWRKDDGVYVTTSSFSLKLPEEMGSRVLVQMGKAVKLGIRPGDLHVPKMASFEVTAENTLKGRVNVIEPSATGCVVYLQTLEESAQDFTATFKVRLPAQYLGKEVPLAIDPRKIQLFDAETERSLL